MKQEVVKLTRQLVEIPSTTGNKEETQEVLDLVSEYLGSGVASATYERNGIVSRIWGDTQRVLTPHLLLSGHIDVVGADAKMFVPSIRDGKMYGRGTCDMKGYVAAMVVAYKKWIEEGGARGVGLVLTGDEERGGFNGTKFLIDEGLKPEVVFIPDGEVNYDIVESQKAPHHFCVIARGKGGHSSKAFEIDNPLNRILELYRRMREKYAIATPQNEWASTFEMTAMMTNNDHRKTEKEIVDKSGKPERVEIDEVLERAGANVIPSEVQAWFSWRWPLEQIPFEQGVDDMNRWCNELGLERQGENVEHGWGEGCLLTDEQKQEAWVDEWKGIIEEEARRKVKFVIMHGATDGRHFYVNGCKNVLVTSGIGGGAHASNEWVDIESLDVLARAIYRYQKVVINK